MISMKDLKIKELNLFFFFCEKFRQIFAVKMQAKDLQIYLRKPA